MSRGYRPLLKHAQRRNLPSRAGLTRRQMLKLGTTAIAAGFVGGLHGCRSSVQTEAPEPVDLPQGAGLRVIVIGGGLSGLVCGLTLKQSGADVTVLEAQQRPGGRVVSNRSMLAGETVEFGGEWIGGNHPTWLELARRYHIELLDAPDYNDEPPLVLEGKLLGPDEADALFDEIDSVLANFIELARPIDPVRPYLSPSAQELDSQNVADFIRSHQISSQAQRLMLAVEAADNGVPADRMSLLANLAMIAGGGFEDYYLISESFRTRHGNQRLADALAADLGDDLRFGQSVTHITRMESDAIVQTVGGAQLHADAVVMTVPPTIWGRIQVVPSLPADLAPQMGRNTKLLLAVSNPVWIAGGKTPELVSDGALVQLGWEARKVPQRDRAPTVLTLFSGADSCDRLRSLEPSDRTAQAVAEVSSAFDGLADAVSSDVFVDWPSVPTAGGSYSFPAPGQVTRQGPTLVDGVIDDGLAPLYFAGEHTSYGFTGYMEGALESGLRAARTALTAASTSPH